MLTDDQHPIVVIGTTPHGELPCTLNQYQAKCGVNGQPAKTTSNQNGAVSRSFEMAISLTIRHLLRN
jgi:hypothetical protein